MPTPIDQLLDTARIVSIDSLPDENFLSRLSDGARHALRSALQKVRGVADLKERVNYVPGANRGARERFVSAHELGHQVLPWHRVDTTYLESDETLRRHVNDRFEREANLFGAEVIFQGSEFGLIARDYRPGFAAIFKLAEMHAASRQATAWRFVEEQNEALVLLQYYPGGSIDEFGNRVLRIWNPVASSKFRAKYENVDLPPEIRTGHPWLAARDHNGIMDGDMRLRVDNHEVRFDWNSWWNQHSLLVLLRKRPLLSVVGSLVRS